MKLTKQQIGYVTARIESLASQRVAKETTRQAGAEPVKPVLKFEEKYELIRTGKAKLKPFSKLSKYTNLEDAYEYPTFERSVSAYETVIKRRADIEAKVKAKVDAEKQTLIDRVMLGDADEALDALKAFEAA